MIHYIGNQTIPKLFQWSEMFVELQVSTIESHGTYKTLLRYVGVMCVSLVHVLCSPLLPIAYTHWALCCISKPTMKHQQKSYLKLHLPWYLAMLMGKACLFISQLNTWAFSIMLTITCEIVDNFGYVIQPLSNMCLYVVFMLFDPHITTN